MLQPILHIFNWLQLHIMMQADEGLERSLMIPIHLHSKKHLGDSSIIFSMKSN